MGINDLADAWGVIGGRDVSSWTDMTFDRVFAFGLGGGTRVIGEGEISLSWSLERASDT